MNSDDIDFERDLMAYSEIETVTEEANSIPKTIQRYQQRIHYNNTTSIFDQDYTLPPRNSESERPSSIDETRNSHEGLLKDEAQVIRVACGRGRGGRNQFYKPGDQVNGNLPQEEQDVFEQLRKVAPIGYSNEITETAVRAHHKSKHADQTSGQSSPVISIASTASVKSSSPASIKTLSPIQPKRQPGMHCSDSFNYTQQKDSSPYQTASGTECTTSDIESSDIASCEYKTPDNSPLKIDSKEEPKLEDQVQESLTADEKPPAKPIPLSELLRQSRIDNRRRQLEKLHNQAAEKRLEEELASQRKIKELLEQDRVEEELRKVEQSDRSDSSSVTSRNSRDDTLSWRARNNSPPRYAWGQFSNRSSGVVNINSILDFPPL